jgi:hypothetical protein
LQGQLLQARSARLATTQSATFHTDKSLAVMQKNSNMKRFVLNFYFILFIQSIFGQTDNLEPVKESIISYNDSVSRCYYLNINSILLKDLKSSSLARVIVLPSFSREYVLSIEIKNGLFYFIKRIVNKPIWRNSDLKSIKVIETNVRINDKLFKTINDLFFTALLDTQYPKEIAGELDGESYYFLAYKDFYGERIGKTWTPKKGTKMADLVYITQLIDEMIEKNNTELADTIIKESNLLLKRFDNK